MSLIYIPIESSAELAEQLSTGVNALAHPNNAVPDDYVSRYAFGWEVHPTTGAVALALDQQQFIPLNVAANTAPLLDLIAGLKDLDDQPLTTPEERAQLDQVVRYFGGSTVPLEYLVPPKAMVRALTYDQAEAAGWFVTPR